MDTDKENERYIDIQICSKIIQLIDLTNQLNLVSFVFDIRF